MRRNRDYSKRSKRPWLNALLILLLAVVILGIAFVLINSFGEGKVENNLLQAGIEYYDSKDVLKPAAMGECSIVTLDQLLTNEYIKNEKIFNVCDKDATYVKVCKLESGKYHYTPVVDCGNNEDTRFDDWHEGNEADLIADKSDVRFTYQALAYSKKSKVYYPSNEKKASNVKELYISIPDNQYTYKDKGVEASKWYTEETGTNYWNNGNYSSTQPNGYTNRGKEGTPTTSISTTKPASTNYRTITEVLLYRTKNINKPYILNYMCIDKNYSENSHVISDVPCESRTEKNFNITAWIYYTCDGKSSVNKDDACPSGPTSDWSTSVCTNSNTVQCETMNGYKYVDRRWQWYSTGTYRKYYPSGAASATGENTYYVSAPISSAKQDNSTTTTAYKFYKLIEENSGSEGEWINLNDDYVSEDELIKLFNRNNYEVKSLEDILKNEKIKYSIKLEYSNRR